MLEEISPYNEIAHLREILNEVIREINEHEAHWLKPLYKLERQAANDIVELKAKVAELEQKNRAMGSFIETYLKSRTGLVDEKPSSERDWS